ncbi:MULTISPECIES: glycosyltransferase family 4 protein [Clostridium]|uniref:glycosyltransferase family 4 protein n=1 Tax=Clostridium TaxID=1485 RepID=UPI0002CB542F|nr:MULTISPECIES: glycosyltransferase family 4 protein [Clostridium]EMU55270.1 glycosyl transferase, group 1 family [Clostridium butyricum DKU-01]KIU08524.1 glycosyl transferase, group 1 family protein [Clostridium butyricum]MBA8968357.1 glycosyltransferase involved in cell wall biosynthesis [Clostridium butyricum]MBA8970588.1 glycosyltransferase involved in cell wall biosynthesis [Clostridium butyricum]MBC2426687.1 glycosyltransferase family 4 protein [Clostridium butyricum]
MDKKKMLVYAHYFYPDVASTGQILTELCDGLKENFDITVICVVPSYSGKIDEKYKKHRFYEEEIGNIKIIRVRVPEFNKSRKVSRIINLISYFINAIIATFNLQKQDYVFSISQPPILGGLLGVIGKVIKKGKLIYNIQDFNPEQTIAVGYSKNKFLVNIALYLDKFSCKMSNKIILVGRDMQQTLNNRFVKSYLPNNIVINNWIDEKSIYPLSNNNTTVYEFKERYNLQNKFVIMYSGNIGLYYDLENLIKIIGKFNNRDDVKFAFVGDGTIKKNIENYALENNLKNVVFIPYQEKSDLNYSLNAADVHFVVNSKGIKGISVPSKLYGVMACGKMILGILEKGSEARIIIEESGCGICSEPEDYEDIYIKIKYILDNKQLAELIGEKGRKYLEKNLTKELSISKYRESILSI